MKLFRWKLISDKALDALREERDRARRRNESFQAELLERETLVDALKTNLADARSTLAQCNELRLETIKRAEVAEGIVRGQAQHIAQLQKSNDTALQSIVDMRRVGFSLPTDIAIAHNGEELTSVDDDDRAMLKDRPEFVAAED